MRARALIVALAVLSHTTFVLASWPLAFYGMIENVVFEPDEAGARRVQVWGAFTYTQPAETALNVAVSPRVERGYLYFALPDGASPGDVRLVRREWADLKAVAGRDQAVGFGAWDRAGTFNQSRSAGDAVFVPKPVNGQPSSLRVRPATEIPSNPAPYQTNVGVVKLSASGNHASLVGQLRTALKP